MSKKKKILITIILVEILIIAAVYVSEQKNRNKFEEGHVDKVGFRPQIN